MGTGRSPASKSSGGRNRKQSNNSIGGSASEVKAKTTTNAGGGTSGSESKIVNINEARQAKQRKQEADRGITAEKQLEYKRSITKLTDKQINSMTRAQLSSWLLKSGLAQVGEFFGPKDAADARRRHELLTPENSTASLRKSLKYARRRYKQEFKTRGIK